MPSQLRREKCALRGAFLRWVLFNALLAFVSAWFFTYEFYGYRPRHDWDWFWKIGPILGGPEMMVEHILRNYAPGYSGWGWGESWVHLFWVLAALRLGAVFAWGVARLRRGKHAPYALTLWLIVVCAFVTARMSAYHYYYVQFYALQAWLTITGIIIFAFQCLWPPALEWKMPE